MNYSRQVRRNASIGAESLESRQLLNAHVPHQATVHVEKATQKAHTAAAPPAPKPPKVPHEVSGTLTGVSTFTLNPNNANQGYDAYYATAMTQSGPVTYSGNDAFTSLPISPTTYSDTYFNGFTVLYAPGNNDVAISYVGTGHSPVQNNGNYTATLKGEAIVITGPATGHEYAFKATLSGNEATDAFTIKFTLKD